MKLAAVLLTLLVSFSACGKKADSGAGSAVGSDGSGSAAGSNAMVGSGSNSSGSAGSGSGSASGDTMGGGSGSAPAPATAKLGVAVTAKDKSGKKLDDVAKKAAEAAVGKLANATLGGSDLELDVEIVSVDAKADEVACKVMIHVLILPAKDMKGMINGGASVKFKKGDKADEASATSDCVSAVIEDLVTKKANKVIDDELAAKSVIPTNGARPKTVTDDMVAVADRIVAILDKLGAALEGAKTDCKAGLAAIKGLDEERKKVLADATKFAASDKDPEARTWFESNYVPKIMKSYERQKAIAAACAKDKDFTAALEAFEVFPKK